MFAGNAGQRRPIGFTPGFGDMVRPESPPNFGATPGINPQGMMGRIAGMGQPQMGNPMGQPQGMQRPQMDDARKRQLLAMVLSNGGMANGLR